MITKEQWNEFAENGIPEDRILTDDVEPVQLWEKYVGEDPRAICGKGTSDILEIAHLNTRLAKHAGIEACLPTWGKVVDIGAGYNSIQTLLCHNVEYYPCDLIKRTPLTIQINGQLPFEDNSVESVVTCNVFQHITQKQRLQYIKESYRILKQHGTLFVACHMNAHVPPLGPIKYKGDYYCITGDYLNKISDFQELTIWHKVGFSFFSIHTISNGFTGIWFKKKEINHEGN